MEETRASRVKRQKIDKTGRLSALEKLKQLKGSKHKYEVDEMENVYDEVDEQSYGKTVLERQIDDWIVDDGGESGYVEDGREIFDDDLDIDSVKKAAKEELKGPRKRKREPESSKGNIRSMFLNMSSKKKVEEKVSDEDILGKLMSELKNEKDTPKQNTRIKNKFLKTPRTPVNENSKFSEAKAEEKLLESLVNENKKQEERPVIEHKKIEEIEMSIDDDNICSKPIKSKNTTVSKTLFETKMDDDNFVIETVESQEVSMMSEMSSQIIEDSEQDLTKFIGDISDFDFENTEMDSKPNSNTTLNTASTAPPVIDKSKMWKEADIETANDDLFNQVWDEDFGSTPAAADQTPISEKTLPMPTVTDASGNNIFRFFWWDAFEDPYKQPGVVHLFGKVYIDSSKTYVSCSVAVKNIPRRIYLLPREYVQSNSENGDSKESNSLGNVYQEFNEHATKLGIREFRCAEVNKNYAFDREGVPKASEYLEVRYSANDPAIDANFTGRTIEGVFGSTVNPLEMLLIERDIRGPCWLDIKLPSPAGSSFGWSKIQVNCNKMENISVCSDPSVLSTIPPMVIATLNVQVALDTKLQKNEVVMVGILLHRKYQIDKAPPKPPFDQHFCIVSHPKNTAWPIHARDALSKITQTEVKRCETELDLLQELLNILQLYDPDVIVGYDCGFQLDVLMSRIFTLKIQNWSRVGKLKRLTPPYFKGKLNLGQVFCGRPICDIQTSAKELNLKVRSYDLTTLCVAVLGKKEYECKEVKPEDGEKFYSSSDKLVNLITSTMVDASYIIGIVVELNILPLALQITRIAGNTFSRTLSAGRAERNEYLLLHAFHKKGYITPDKRNKKDGNEGGSKKKPAYLGGLVLDPKKGFYDKLILLMDFNSLYPSIIQEYNLCFTTVPGAAYENATDLEIPEGNLEPGVVPTEIRKLVESRGEVKKLLKAPNLSPELKMQYNIRQMALKLTANSMYGCLGAKHCRFYAKGLAALVTAKGREILQNTKSLVEKENYEVIYGDTDSIMINTNILDYEQVFTVGREIKQKVNKLYNKVELDIDGVFRFLLLLNKKKYASVTMTKLPNGQIQMTREDKGLDIVRRDWCHLACETGKQILDQLLSDQPSDTRLEKVFELLNSVAKKIREGEVPLSSLVITKQLSKNPNDYPDKKQAHVSVALRLNGQGGRMWKAGDTIPYIICEDGSHEKSATERAYHIVEFKKGDSLKVDVNYYLLSQIFPVILRLCGPIDGIDDVLLAKSLGLEDLYKPKRTIQEREEGQVPLAINENRFENCETLKFKCRNDKCGTEIEIKDVMANFPTGPQLALSKCPNVECDFQPWRYGYAIMNQIQRNIRKFVGEYYYGQVECENPICSRKMRRITLNTFGTFPKCYVCKDGNVHRINSETKLYNQLSYYLHMFNLNQPSFKNTKESYLKATYDTIREFIEKQLKCNAYSMVDLGKLFRSEAQESDIDPASSQNIWKRIEVEDLELDDENDEVEEDEAATEA